MKSVAESCLLTVCLGLCLGWATICSAGEYKFAYATEWGSTTVGTGTARWSISEDRFAMFGDFSSSGLVNVFTAFSGHVSIHSVRTDKGWQGKNLVIASRYGGQPRIAETTWLGDGSEATTTVTPPLDLSKVYPLSDDMRHNVNDPFSAMMTVLEQLKAGHSCETTIQIYDGRRRAELGFVDFGSVQLSRDRDFAYEGEVRVCGMISKPIGGHRRKSRYINKKPDPEDVKVYVAELIPGLLVPVRIEMELFFGRLTTRLDVNESSF